MNSCILMARVIRSPELRYAQETQQPIAYLLVEFKAGKPDDPPSTLKVVAFQRGDGSRDPHPGDLVFEDHYLSVMLPNRQTHRLAEGDRLIVEGRLSMNTLERPEGFREKRAELIASRIHLLDSSLEPALSSRSPLAVDLDRPDSSPVPPAVEEPEAFALATAGPTPPEPEGRNLDDIPF